MCVMWMEVWRRWLEAKLGKIETNDNAPDFCQEHFYVCTPWARSNGCKSRTCPDSGKCIAEQQGCLSRGRI
mgnify:CR=1 FL=1